MGTRRCRHALRAGVLALVLSGASCATPRSAAREPETAAALPRVERVRDGGCDDTGACAGPFYLFEERRYLASCGPVPPEWLGGPLVARGERDVPFDEVRAVPGFDPAARLVVRQRTRFGPCEGEEGRWTALVVPGTPGSASPTSRREPTGSGDAGRTAPPPGATMAPRGCPWPSGCGSGS